MIIELIRRSVRKFAHNADRFIRVSAKWIQGSVISVVKQAICPEVAQLNKDHIRPNCPLLRTPQLTIGSNASGTRGRPTSPDLTITLSSSIKLQPTTNHFPSILLLQNTMKFHSLAGILSPELKKLPYLNSIDFAYNYLNGTIAPEWGLTQLQEISLLGNRLTGKIPPELGNITTLTKLDLEANQLSGTIPSELGSLFHLKSLILSSNQLKGTLPAALAELRNLTNL
ncbi:Leucine-rich repeat-containing protein [Cynara cardunculus var. scolymus]|uniref:Leucine-rich repeat-containing protein n=1 Tax=Cynara cardunculus var. scolymus TaxID=59895 RepID=A0A103Y1U7_CYNCS|nr:Leucine-rich repeat-containing protein [Cynara cardunculus var. scolymus]